MGWSNGTELMGKVIESIYKKNIDFDTRKQIYIDLIDAFGEMDWDNEDECLGFDEAYDSAYNFYYPERDEE